MKFFYGNLYQNWFINACARKKKAKIPESQSFFVRYRRRTYVLNHTTSLSLLTDLPNNKEEQQRNIPLSIPIFLFISYSFLFLSLTNIYSLFRPPTFCDYGSFFVNYKYILPDCSKIAFFYILSYILWFADLIYLKKRPTSFT